MGGVIMDKIELNDVIKFAKMNGMMNWSFEEVLNEYETTKMHHKESKFDPSTLKPFDKILVRDYPADTWTIELFSYNRYKEKYIKGLSYWWKQCIPYNDETKHLLGTKEDCPEYYKWWEE